MSRIILILVSAVLFGYPPELFACSCPAKGTVEQEFNKSDVVFLAQVAEKKSAGIIRPGYTKVRFIPMKVYKGRDLLPNQEAFTVFTPDSEKNCELNFSNRIDYIVFAKGNPAFLKVTSCSLTDIQEKSKSTQIELERLIKK
jgi:hypothetical protein